MIVFDGWIDNSFLNLLGGYLLDSVDGCKVLIAVGCLELLIESILDCSLLGGVDGLNLVGFTALIVGWLLESSNASMKGRSVG